MAIFTLANCFDSQFDNPDALTINLHTPILANDDPAILRQQKIGVNSAVLNQLNNTLNSTQQSQRVSLELFDDTSVDIDVESVTSSEDGSSWVFIGKVPDASLTQILHQYQ